MSGPERWWWSTVDLYLPQWIWALPALALGLASLRIARRWAWFQCLPFLWVAGPMMGFTWSSPAAASAGRPSLRVMTYNIKWSRRDLPAVADQIAHADPDLLLLQDNGGKLFEILRDTHPGWSVERVAQYVVATRLPLADVSERALVPAAAKDDRVGTALRCRVRLGDVWITVYNVHLITPRSGLGPVREGESDGVEMLARNSAERLAEAEGLARCVQAEEGPLIVAGDLNAPEPSLVCRQLTSLGLADAFSAAGRGYGYTYGHSLHALYPFLRLDHILMSGEFAAASCRAGGTEGSDHCPVVADLWLRG